MQSLPSHSHYRRAVADDDDLQQEIERHAARSGTEVGGRRRPSVRDWTEHDELRACLTDVGNLIQQAIGASVTPKGKSPPKFKATRRPLTAADRAQHRREQATHSEIVSQMIPKG